MEVWSLTTPWMPRSEVIGHDDLYKVGRESWGGYGLGTLIGEYWR
jgi:hypothetical protein